MSNFENQFEDKFNPNTYYRWNQDPQLLNDIWTKLFSNSGAFINRPDSSAFLDEAYYLIQDYPDDNVFSEDIYLPDDIDSANFFCNDDVSMVLFKSPFDYISLHLEGSDTNLVTLERIQGSIIAPGIGTTTIGIAVTDIGSYISCTPLAINNVKFNTNTFDVGIVGGGSGNTNVKGDFKVNIDKFTVDSATGDTDVKGDFRVNTNKFTVDSATGITSCLGDFKVNTDKFTVDSATGDTYIDRDLIVNRNLTADYFYGDGSGLSGIFPGAAGLDGYVQYNNNGSLGGASQLYYDDINHRVGIGTTNPTSKLHVNGGLVVSGVSTIGIASTSSLTVNSTLSFELISNTNLRILVRGTDGVTRVGIVTLS